LPVHASSLVLYAVGECRVIVTDDGLMMQNTWCQ